MTMARYPPADAATMFVIWLIAIRVLYAVALFPAPTDSLMRALLAGFACIHRALKPTKKANTYRKRWFPDATIANMAASLLALERRTMGFLPTLSEMAPQVTRPAAVLRLITLWMTPSWVMLKPRDSM